MRYRIVRTFRDLAAAEVAREELLAAGFARDAVELSSLHDEAGAEKGNFTVGDDPSIKGGHDYKEIFAPDPAAPDRCKIMVAASDPDQMKMAEIILERHGATDIDATTRAIPDAHDKS